MKEHVSPLSQEVKKEVLNRPALAHILKTNADSAIFPEIKEVLIQRDAQSGESKKNIIVPGFAHIDFMVDQLERFAAGDIPEARLHPALIQTTTEPQPDFPGGAPTNGPLPVGDETVQLRLDHVYSLLGSYRIPPTDEQLQQQHFALVSMTNLGHNIQAIEERTQTTVAVKVVQKKE